MQQNSDAPEEEVVIRLGEVSAEEIANLSLVPIVPLVCGLAELCGLDAYRHR